MKIATTTQLTMNAGDGIQVYALERLLPRVDLRLERDNLQEIDNDTAAIFSGWFNHRVMNRPFPKKGHQLYIGFHAATNETIPRKTYLPLGARDADTLIACRQLGVETWLSYCASLTLPWYKGQRTDEILLVDVPNFEADQLPPEITHPAQQISHFAFGTGNHRETARELLERYEKARLVITTRLHAMVPCVAFGTPVVLIPPPHHDGRFNGYIHMAWHNNNAPWSDPTPRLEEQEVIQLAAPFKYTVEKFLKRAKAV